MEHLMHQFEVRSFVPLNLFGFDVSFTNAALFMVLALVASISLLWFLGHKQEVIPSTPQSIAESLFNFIKTTAQDSIGEGYKNYLPFIFSVFIFILMGNLLGLFPYSFTFTSQLAVVGGIAIFCTFVSIVVGIKHQGLGWFRIFFPKGVPCLLAPILIPVEIISFISKPFSLTVRLVLNMFVGHILLKVAAGYVYSMGILGTLPLLAICLLVVFELFVAFLQAYIFTILTSIYLGQSIHSH